MIAQEASTSVGARAVRSGREGLYGRPRPVDLASMSGNTIVPHPAALAPTDVDESLKHGARMHQTAAGETETTPSSRGAPSMRGWWAARIAGAFSA